MDDTLFSQSNCFLCGVDISENITDEHIFPRWLQKKYNLWNETIFLLNGTQMPYRQLRIPCCQSCNGEHLSQLEGRISRAVELGYEEFIKLNEDDIFYWSAKLMYGLFFKELSLNLDRRNPYLGSITTPDIMKRFRTLHMLLQGVRIQTNYMKVKPYSLFIFKTLKYDNRMDFDYLDSYHQQVYSMRMGDIGFVISLEDSSVQKKYYEDYFKPFKDKILHPIQLREIYSKILYKQHTANFVPNYVIIEESDNSRSVLINEPAGHLFSEWSWEEYARVLSYSWQAFNLKFEDIYVPPDKAISFLNNDDGSFMEIPTYAIFKAKN